MSIPESPAPLPKLPFVVAAAVLLLSGTVIVFAGSSEPGSLQIVSLAVCALLGAVLLVIPFVFEELHSRDARAAARARGDRLAALAEGSAAAVERLHATTAELQLVAEQTRRQQALAEQLPERLASAADATLAKFSENLAETTEAALAKFNATLVATTDEAARGITAEIDRAGVALVAGLSPVEQRLAEAAAASVERLQTAAAELHKQIDHRQTLAEELPARLTTAADGALVKFNENLAATADATLAKFNETLAATTAEVIRRLAAETDRATAALTETASVVSSAAAAAAETATRVVANQPSDKPVEPSAVASPEPILAMESEASTAADAGEAASSSAPPSVELAKPTPAPEPALLCASASKAPPMNPVEFQGEIAYDALAAAMDSALSS